MLLGAQNAMAGNYLKGSWDGWKATTEFNWAGGSATASLTLDANTTYTFKMLDTGMGGDQEVWYGNSGTIAYSVSSWEFTSGGNDCTIQTGPSGTYVFTLTWPSNPMISVTFPNGENTYTISFTNPDNWSNVSVYSINGSGGTFPTETHRLGSWPGTPVTSINGLYTITFSIDEAPETIIWNNGVYSGGKESSSLAFINNAIYNKTGQVSYLITPTNTAENYATFYSIYNTELPDGVTAYKGDLDGSNLVLSDFDSQVVPANTPVVLRASNSTAFNITATTKSAGSASGENDLEGTDTQISASSVVLPANATLCVLGVNGASVGFYRFTGENLAANRAYLIVPGAGAAPAIHFTFDGATDIKAVKENETVVKFIENGKLFIQKNGVVYDMTGRIVK